MTGDQASLFHPEAAAEIEAGVAWYAARSRKVAEQFLAELDRALTIILRIAPQLGASYWTVAPLPSTALSLPDLLS